ncbi:MAG: histidine kinase, partial [Chloroflexota bacterium]
ESAEALSQSRLMLKEVDLVKVNEEEAALLTGVEQIDQANPIQVENAALALLKSGPEIIVITLGSEGSYFQIKSGGAYIPPYEVDTVDAIGCGDAFIAGLLSKLVVGDDWRQNISVEYLTEALNYANAVGALTSLKRGVIPALPTKEEVEKFINNHPR